ncbi:unnamed protein product [Dimorphilus gyrociliatus]|uniref:Cadherin domain-containing protein n=1 Tax=Dimorphilus gyrociliatus TaxID=2664684 RepID=A0A7I8VI25_9ANNE|nr:unnamed protein product [Dimorphilus gyrociliatus]
MTFNGLLIKFLVVFLADLSVHLADKIKFEFTYSNYNLTAAEESQVLQHNRKLAGVSLAHENWTYDKVIMEIVDDDSGLFIVHKRPFGDRFVVADFSTKPSYFWSFNYEERSIYNFKVKASLVGESLFCFAHVTVRVEDRNDLGPYWVDEGDLQRNISVPENITTFSKLARFEAKDYDYLTKHSAIYYSFLEYSEEFFIDPLTGWVIVAKPLLLEKSTKKIYKLSVIAINGYKSRPYMKLEDRFSQKITLIVNVIPVNIYRPEFRVKELPNLIEDGAKNVIYAVFDVTDRDKGRKGQIDSVRIVDGDSHGYFDIVKRDKKEYRLIARKSVDREAFPMGFNLTIEAKDKGNPFQSNNYSIHVAISDMNDNAPHFLFKSNNFTAYVSECALVSTPVIKLNAKDTDLGKNAEIFYSIESGNERNWFSIDGRLGVIRIANSLDYEKQKTVVLIVKAQDQANKASRKVSSAVVRISLEDCNDNFPVFKPKVPKMFVSENSVSKLILQFKATDADSGYNGKVTYILKNCNKKLKCPFVINRNNGKLFTTNELDYDYSIRVWNLIVVARDSGSPFQRTAHQNITLEITNVNDNPPIMMKKSCTIEINKRATSYTFRELPVNAMDPDGNPVRMEITGGTAKKSFSINPESGVLTFNNTDIRKRRHQRGTLTENLFVSAKDSDKYKAIRPTKISVKYLRNRKKTRLIRCLDNEEALIAINNTKTAPHFNSRDLPMATRLYENRFAPQFLDFPQEVSIDEDVAPNVTIATITARDDDPGYNGRLVFVISSGNEDGAFKMQTTDTFGRLLIFGGVDRERKKLYKLSVTVSDSANIPKMQTRELIVNVRDVNDNYPIFERKIYRISIPENTKPNSEILQVSATDADTGPNSMILYKLENERFNVDEKTGRIKVMEELDREEIDNYELIVTATDMGRKVQLESSTRVIVDVTDVNDNVPVCLISSPILHVREDLPVGSVVTVVHGKDGDLGNSGRIRYNFVRKTLKSKPPFSIDKTTGIIRLQTELRYSLKTSYNLTILLKDRGKHSLSSRCKLKIEITDVDENRYSPRFGDSVFSFAVPENVERGTFIAQLNAVDKDKKDNEEERNYDLTYSIRGGTGLGLFTINNEGTYNW